MLLGLTVPSWNKEHVTEKLILATVTDSDEYHSVAFESMSTYNTDISHKVPYFTILLYKPVNSKINPFEPYIGIFSQLLR